MVSAGDGIPLGHIPSELTARRQWVVWRYEDDEHGGKPKKVPYTPGSGVKASVSESQSWRTFEEARATALDGLGYWNGLGYMFSADDLYCGIDLDGCRNPATGELAQWARAIVSRFNTYAEVSPSGKGVKLWLKGQKPRGPKKFVLDKGVAIEVYDRRRYFTVTGQHLAGTPTTIEARQSVLDIWYGETFPPARPDATAHPPIGGFATSNFEDTPQSVALSDAELVEHARRSSNGPKFIRLWEGDDIDARGDTSTADLMLCRLLAFWTAKDPVRIDRLFRQSGRYATADRVKKWDGVHYADGTTYGEATIAKAIASQEQVYTPGAGGKRDDRRTVVPYPWQQVTETAQDREKRRRKLSARIAEHVRAHLLNPDEELLVVTAPPGSGKSTKVAELGMGRDIAYIAERHDVAESIDSLPYYHHLRAPTVDTCPYHEQHSHFAELGFNTLQWHQSHGCTYAQQFGRDGSTLYMVEHVPTPYPARHQDGIIVDEMSLPKWLPEHQFTVGHLRSALLSTPPDAPEARLLKAVDRVLFETERVAGDAAYPQPVHGRALFDELNQHCDGQLHAVVEELASNEEMLNPRRTLTEEFIAKPDAIVPNILPHLLAVLIQELPIWCGGGDDWNSHIRLARVHYRSAKKKQWVLGITERRRFHPDVSPARVLLDATADEETLRAAFDMPVRVVPSEVPPPPHMRHLHLAIRYSLTSMRARHGRDRKRVLAQLKYLLRQLNPDGSKRVALITFFDAVNDMGEELGIPAELRGWFWAERGSNKKEDADILLVVGTPALSPDEVARLARALHGYDTMPIDARSEEVDGRRRYEDPRMQHLSDTLTNAELTQCAHRNRPLWHDERVVVTFCQGTIDYLPITEHIQELPQLDGDGTRVDARREAERSQRCREALLQFLSDGHWPTRAEMRQATGLAQQYVSRWMREEAPQVQTQFEQDRREHAGA